MRTFAMLTFVLCSMGVAGAQQWHVDSGDMASAFGPASPIAGIDARKITRHVLIAPDGGSIEMNTKAPDDEQALVAVRAQLPLLPARFAAGQFPGPTVTHSGTVLGTTDVSKIRDHVAFTYADTAGGGRVTATTSNPDALKAVYTFLRSLAGDKKNGDTWDVVAR